MDISEFRKLPIMGILRGIDEAMIEPIAGIIESSGLKAIEVTMNTPGAPGLIKGLRKAAGAHVAVGAGTVLTLEDLHAALDAGATFLVLPTRVDEVVAYCAANKIPVFPGALTPQEIHNAWRAGATMVKVFPAKIFGPSYFKEIRGPFQDVKLLACGGVSTETIQSFFENGASAVAFGSSIFRTEWLSAGGYGRIETALKALINKYFEWRGGRQSL